MDWRKKILIVDEAGFSRICTALLGEEGYDVKTISDYDDLIPALSTDKLDLIITSYPFTKLLFDYIKDKGAPTIVLADHINKELVSVLKDFDKSYCMIKPLDYKKFTTVVRQIIVGDLRPEGGYAIV